MFACAHPAIDPGMRTPLILQTTLGLTADEIAAAFLLPPKTMGQRLVRAKLRTRDAGIPFRVPDAEELPARLAAVLDAIYAVHTTGWHELGDDPRAELASEALWLGQLLVSLLPEQPEPKGMLALMLHQRAPCCAPRSGRSVRAARATGRGPLGAPAGRWRPMRACAPTNRIGPRAPTCVASPVTWPPPARRSSSPSGSAPTRP